MGRLVEIVIDADRPAQLARFWAEALDGYAVAPYDESEIARLAALDLTPETDPVVLVEGPGTRLCFHLRPGPRAERNRIHIDIASDNRAAEVQRLMVMGATFRREAEGYTVLADPEGNNFCVCDT